MKGRTPCVMAARDLSGEDSNSTRAAASIEPAPATTNATPALRFPMTHRTIPAAVTIARNRL